MEIETAARRQMLTVDVIKGYVQSKVFKFSLLEHVQGTSGRALVIRRSNGWASPDPVQSSEYPLLVFDCWADPTRDSMGGVAADDAVDKAYALYRAVNAQVHGIRDVWWGAGGANPGLRIISAARWGEPFHMTASDQHGSGPKLMGTPLQDCAVVTVQYAIHTAH